MFMLEGTRVYYARSIKGEYFAKLSNFYTGCLHINYSDKSLGKMSEEI